jgi:hypothetical protein
MPSLALVEGAGVPAGPSSGDHLLACHNPVAAEEVEAGRPLLQGFRPAPPPEDRSIAQETA